jgi:hypothetical protein
MNLKVSGRREEGRSENWTIGYANICGLESEEETAKKIEKK